MIKKNSISTLLLTAGAMLASSSAFAVSTVTVNALATANGTDTFNTIQSAIASFASGGVNAGSAAPFTINVVAASGPYVETMSLDDANTTLQGDIVIQSSVANTPVDCRLNVTNTDDGLLIYQNIHDVTISDFIFSPQQGAGVADDLVKIDKNSNSPANQITFNRCIFTDVANAGGPLISAIGGPYSAPAAFTGQLTTTSDTLMKVWSDNAEYVNVTINDSLFYGANCQGLQFGGIATAGTTSDYTVTINDSTFAYCGSASTSPIDVQGNGAQPMILTVDGCLFTGSRYHAIYSHAQNTNAHETHLLNTVFTNNATRGFSGNAQTALTINNVVIKQATANAAIVYCGWKDVTWNNLTVSSAGSNAVLTANAGAANTATVRNSIFSGTGTAFGTVATTTFPGINVDDSAIVQDGTEAVTGIGAPTGLVVGSNIIALDPAYADKANDNFNVRNTAYATAGTASSNLGGGASYVGGVAPAAISLSGVAASLDFGTVAVSTTSTPQTITVTNTGGASATISRALSGADAAEFAATPASLVLAGGGSSDFSVTFSPTTGGGKSATLALSGLSASSSPSSTTLVGNNAGVEDWMSMQ